MGALAANICLAVLFFSAAIAKEVDFKLQPEAAALLALTLAPNNTAVVSGDTARLQCASSDRALTWYFTRLGETVVQTIFDGSFLHPDFVGVYDVDIQEGHVDLLILNATLQQVGVYRCKEQTGFDLHATAGVAIMNDDPVCSTNITTPDITTGEYIEMQCRTHYTNNISPLEMVWTDPSGNPVASNALVVEEGPFVFYQSVAVVRATPPTVQPYRCHTRYAAPPESITTTAKNAPDYTYDYYTPTLVVNHCPYSVVISLPSETLNGGDVLTCTATGHPDPTYTWTHSQTGKQTVGPTITLDRGGVNTYRCEARVNINGVSCALSTTVNISVTVTCRHMWIANPLTPSGRYTVHLQNGKSFEAYCEMGLGLNGGGYTYPSPQSLLNLDDTDIQQIFTDHSNVLLRVRKFDGTQTYGILEQIDQNSDIPLTLGHSQNTGFYPTLNEIAVRLGRPFLYLGFLDVEQTLNDSTSLWGVKVNGNNRPYPKVNGQRNYIALFAGFSENGFFNSGATSWDHCNHILGADMRIVPSGRVIPDEFFMFMETIWQGTCHITTNSANMNNLGISTAAIGFR